MKINEILYCNIEVLNKGKPITLNKVVYLYDGNNTLNDERLLKRYNLPNKLKIINIEIIKSLGFKNQNKDYTEVKKSEEKIRNRKTGSYE